nr:hypothetical protein [Pelagicoccus enzymogenes]
MPRGGEAVPHGFPLSDDFTSNKFGVQWSFDNPGPKEMERVRYGKAFLELAGSGSSPANSSPLTCIVVDQAYEVELSLEMEGDAEGGIFLFYNPKAYVGLGFTGEKVRTYQYAESHDWASAPLEGARSGRG